jgi:hypothetical protein
MGNEASGVNDESGGGKQCNSSRTNEKKTNSDDARRKTIPRQPVGVSRLLLAQLSDTCCSFEHTGNFKQGVIMVASAVFITDLKGKIIISRNYRGDIPMSAADKFTRRLFVFAFELFFFGFFSRPHVTFVNRAEEDSTALAPVWNDDNVTYVFIKHNNLYCSFRRTRAEH